MPDFSGAVALLRKPIEDVYEIAKGAVKEKISIIRVTGKVQALHSRLWKTQQVKTIWHTDRPLSLSSFFYPVYIKGQEEVKIQLQSLKDMPCSHVILLGTVGQGKSILLKYLLGKEIKSGTHIPVLCELRNLKEQTLIEHLRERFNLLLNLDDDGGVFDLFSEQGKLSFLLDGFDEVDSQKSQEILREIDDISYKYSKCRIVLTSRPGTDCKNLTNFNVYAIEPLPIENLENFYKKITKDNDLTSRLMAAISNSPTEIRKLLKTPLLATLLAISYRAAHKIPLDFSEFYDELFQILLVRHDGAKLGWRRQRKTKLNDREIQQVFEAFCYATRKKQLLTIEKEQAYKIADDSLNFLGIKTDGQFYVEDIRNITCLILEEGKKYCFVHSSVQQFFSSKFIKNLTEAQAGDFYTKLLTKNSWDDWSAEISFLTQIDSHRISKYFLVPDLNNTLKFLLKDGINLSTSDVENHLNSLSVLKEKRPESNELPFRYIVNRKHNYISYTLTNLESRIYQHLFAYNRANHWSIGFNKDPSSTQRTYLQIAQDRGVEFYETFMRNCFNSFQQLLNERAELTLTVNKGETLSPFVDI